MLQIFSPLQSSNKQIRSVLTQILFYPIRYHFASEAPIENPKTPSSSKTHQADTDVSPVIAKSVISKCLRICDAKIGDPFSVLSFKDHILRLSNVYPEIVLRFWRVSVLKPEDVLEILLGFESKAGKYEIGVGVESLWGIFNWARGQSREFEHLPCSCKIMASMLVGVGLFREVEFVLSRRECQGLLLDSEEVFSGLIEGYVEEFELDRAISIYEGMRRLCLVPSKSSYRALLMYLVEINEAQLMHRVYLDLIDMGMEGGGEERLVHDNVVRLLCVDGKVQEARDLVKKVMRFGIEPSDLVMNAIICGYCEKKDYDDMLSFFTELRLVPGVILGNKILFSLCKSFGVEQATVFLQKLEDLGFCSDESSLGILIGSSCSEGKLKNAFFFISDIMSRGLKPHVYSYNALLSGMFKEGMWMQTREVLVEMKDVGVAPILSTFRVLLAGFCKARQFDEVKAVVCEMADRNLVKLSSLEDPLTKGFVLLGLSPLTVKIRRDNDKGLLKTEFFDKLGNGLYLDTDLDFYEKRIDQVLDDAMVPDFNAYIIEKLRSPDTKGALKIVDEMKRWGQEISLPALSSLFSFLSKAPFGIKIINHHLGVLSKSTFQLDQNTLNTLVQTFSRKGFSFRARTIFDGMARRGYTVSNDTFTALLLDTCKKGDLRGLHYYLMSAQEFNWLPEVKDGKALLSYLCKNKWYKEALELFENMAFVHSSDLFDIFHTLIEALCCQGFTSTGSVFLDEFSKQATISDHIAYSHIVSGFCKEKRFVEAVNVLETILSQNLLPSLEVSIELLSQLCFTNPEKAVELKNLCSRYEPCAQLRIHCAYINGLCKSGRIEEATSLVLSEGLINDDDILNALIECYCVGNNFKKVRELLGFMIRKDFSISSSSYSNMVRLACTGRKSSLALALKELVLSVGHIPKLVLYNILIFHISSLRNTSLLDAVIDEFLRKALQFDEVTYNYVIRGFLLSENVPLSLHYLTTMIKQDHRPSNRSLRGVITCLCRNGEVEAALNLSREMESRGWIHGLIIQNSIVDALVTNGRLHEAIGFLDRIAPKDLIPDNIKYDYLIKQFYQHRRLDKAVDLLNIMLRKGSVPESTSYDYVIRGLCDSQKLDVALDFHTEMLYRDLKPSLGTWDALIYSLCDYGRVEEAEGLLKWMIRLSETPTREAFGRVINKYRSEKNSSKTSEVLKVMQQMGYEPDFDTHWSLISNLSDSSKKDGKSSFLSSLLSGFGFVGAKNSKAGNKWILAALETNNGEESAEVLV